jgi:signal transduction histidine kinase
MSHELRTPLNAIIGFSELMLVSGDKFDAERHKEYLNSILSSGRHLLDIINDVLDLARVEAGKMTLSEEEVDLAQTVGSCTRLMAGNAEENGIALITDLPGHLPSLHCDSRKVKQILLNLLSNAIKFTPADGTITIAARLEADGDLTLSVQDTGEGIPGESLDSVMGPFNQVESGLNRRYNGAGLGLPLSKAMAELHDGSLRIESAPDKGTTVSVRFPASRTSASRLRTRSG